LHLLKNFSIRPLAEIKNLSIQNEKSLTLKTFARGLFLSASFEKYEFLTAKLSKARSHRPRIIALIVAEVIKDKKASI
jgi:hypothetical protein